MVAKDQRRWRFAFRITNDPRFAGLPEDIKSQVLSIRLRQLDRRRSPGLRERVKF
jgi:hypothetical protein